MHELLAKIDDHTYQRIIEDARLKGIEPREWVSHAINEFLSGRQPAIKEIPPCENETCSTGAVHVHAEVYTPHPDGTCHDIVEQLQQQVRDLESERDNLKVILGQKNEPGNNVPGDEAEILTLHCEIEKNSFELDEMEAALERLRLERVRSLADPGGKDHILHIEKEIERQEYEVENFRLEIAEAYGYP